MSNHLGSTACIFPLTGLNRTPIAQQITDAYGVPVTLQGAVDPQRSRTSFVGRDVDKESDLGAFGARLYSSEYGTFVAVDKMWENYAAVTVYQCSINSPLVIKDYDELQITAVGPKNQQAVRSSLPCELREFVVFDGNVLNAAVLRAGIGDVSETSNAGKLLYLAEHQDNVDVRMVGFNEPIDVVRPLYVRGENNGDVALEISLAEISKNNDYTGRSFVGGLTLASWTDDGIGQREYRSQTESTIVAVAAKKVGKSRVGSVTAHELCHAWFLFKCRDGQEGSWLHFGVVGGSRGVDAATNDASRQAEEPCD
jgi:hypothetical protein